MPIGRTLRRAVLTITGVTALVAVAPAAAANEPEPAPAIDTVGPALLDATADPAQVSVSLGPAVVAVSVRLADTDGVVSATARLGNGPAAELARTSGSSLDGTWSGVATVPAYTPMGEALLHVAAQDSTGAPSAPVVAAVTVADAAPAAPASLTVSAVADAGLRVSWTPPVANGGSAVTGYSVTLERAPGTDPLALVPAVAVLPADAREVVVPGLTSGARYVVRVAASNAAGAGAELVADATTDLHDVTVPDAPTAVSVASRDRALYVTWTAPASSGGVALTSFHVLATPRSVDVAPVSLNVAPSAVGVEVPGLRNGVTYDVAVTALNAVGVGLASSTAPGTPRSVPGVVSVASVVAGDGSVDVAWHPPASDGGAPVTSYVVTATPNGAQVTVPASEQRVNVRDVVNGAALTFTVRAVNAAGVGPASAPSAAVVPHQAARLVVDRQPAGRIVHGTSSVIWAALRSRAGTGIAGQRVELQAKIRPSSTWQVLKATTTDARGRVSFHVTLPATAALRLHHPLTTVAAATAPVRSVYVAMRVGARPNTTRVRLGTSLGVRGTVSPAHGTGQRVRLQRLVRGRWVNLAYGRMTSPTAYAVTFTPRSLGSYPVRVIKAADGDHETGISRVWRQYVVPESVADIARAIRNNPRITLETEHVSGVRDLAYARRNVVDVASGRRARRSAYENAPGGLTSMDRRVLLALRAMGARGRVTVSELAGGSHAPGSSHYSGRALDVSWVNGEHVAPGSSYGLVLTACRQFGATHIWHPSYDPVGGHSNHVHCDWS